MQAASQAEGRGFEPRLPLREEPQAEFVGVCWGSFLCVGVLGVLCDGRWEALPVQSASQPTRGEKLLRFVLWNGE